MTPVSSNLLAYGPVETPVNGFTAAIAGDGALELSGVDGLAGGRGVAWTLDASRLTPGIYVLSSQEPGNLNYYVGIFVGSGMNGGNRVAYIPPGGKRINVSLAADQIAKGVKLGILLYQAGSKTPFGPDTLHLSLTPAGQPDTWERPDDTSASGGD